MGALDVRESLNSPVQADAKPGTHINPDTLLHDTLPGTGLTEQRLPFVSGLTLVACDEFESRLKSYAELAFAVREHAHPSVIRSNT